MDELKTVIVGMQDRGLTTPGWIVHKMCPPCAEKFYETEAKKYV